jgi:outer membrane protein assembly factor BamB
MARRCHVQGTVGGRRVGHGGWSRLCWLLRGFALLVPLSACSGDVIGEFPSPPAPAITASPSVGSDEGIIAEIAIDGSPCFLVEAGDRVWVTAFDGDELVEIDPATNEVVDTHRMPGGPCGMVERGGTLWIETPNAGVLVAFDPERGEVIDRIRVPGGVVGVTSTPTGFWGIAGQAEEVVQIDPGSGEVLGRIDLDGPLGGLVFARDQIWVAAAGALVRIDPRTRSIVEEVELESFEPEGLAVGGDLMWLSSSFEQSVLRYDLARMRVRDRLPVDDALFGGVVIGDSYWVSGNNTLYRLDAGSGQIVDQLDLVGFGPMPAAGNLWTVDFLSNTVFRLSEPVE